MNIILTGFMGTGKSVVGKELAKRLNWPFYDTDEMIERDTGMKISDIFEKNGEAYFRELETKAVNTVALGNESVIACGGGVVLNIKNMRELEKNGVIICLTATPEKIYERVKENKDRPLLQVDNPILKITEMLDYRKNYYRRCDMIIDTTEEDINSIVKMILNSPKVVPFT